MYIYIYMYKIIITFVLKIELHKKKGCVDKQILNSSTQFVTVSTLKTRADVVIIFCLSL